MTVPGDALLKHGYTLRDLDRVTRWALQSHRRRGFYRGEDDFDIAYGAISMALYSAEETPSDHELMQAGERALEKELRLDLKAHGRRSGRDGVHKAYAAYWHSHMVSHFPDEQITDRIALVQVLPLLTPRQCEALLAFTVHGSTEATAEVMGIEVKTAQHHLAAAREKFRTWFLEHETPVVHRDMDDTCRRGHDRAEHTRVHATNGRRYCHRCELDDRRDARQRKAAA